MYRILSLIIIINLLVADGVTAEVKYRKYQWSRNDQELLSLSFTNHKVSMNLYGTDTSETIVFERDDVTSQNGEIFIHNRLVFGKDAVVAAGESFSYDLISRTEVLSDGESDTRLNIYRKVADESEFVSTRKRNIVAALEDIHVTADQFVRGSVIGFWCNIQIDGEVNEDVIALYGDIKIGYRSVIRGDVIAINGAVDISKEATIYGEIRSTNLKQKYSFDKWERWHRRDKDFSAIVKFHYNRVDGATPYLGMSFADEDSLLPEINVYAGYGFTSERGRYYAGVEQLVSRRQGVALGGAYYRRLASPDDWILSETENTVFALLAREDYKDYYEAEGGYAYIKLTPRPFFSMETGILVEEYKWLDGHRDLWSLFGGSKKFRPNFSGVDEDKRDQAILEIDERSVTSLIIKAEFDTWDEDDAFEESFWKGFLQVESAPDGWNDDYDFVRYLFRFSRYQALDANRGFLMSFTVGGSRDPLPTYRKFYPGGLGTLLGYSHKEFSADGFWLSHLSYRFDLPKTDLSCWLFHQAGQMSDHPFMMRDVEVKHSLGAGISLDDSIRFDLAKRLDRSDSSFKLTVSLGAHF